MFLRALFAFLALPGMVALLIPAIIGMRKPDAGGQFGTAWDEYKRKVPRWLL